MVAMAEPKNVVSFMAAVGATETHHRRLHPRKCVQRWPCYAFAPFLDGYAARTPQGAKPPREAATIAPMDDNEVKVTVWSAGEGEAEGEAEGEVDLMPTFTQHGQELPMRSVRRDDARYYTVTTLDGEIRRFRQPPDEEGGWVDSIPGGDPV